MLRILLVASLAYIFAACSGETNTAQHHDHEGHEHHDHDHAHDHGTEEKGDGTHFGLEITPEGGIGLADVLTKVDTEEGAVDFDLGDGNAIKAVPAKVEGDVSEVCQKAGCWLKIATEDGKEMFISTNHEFFVPTDIVGKKVVVEGNAYKSVTTVEELQHFAEDEGKSAEEIALITEPVSEYKLLAKGLVIKQ